MESRNLSVCVTGGAGYLASFLINQLLHRGYTVHATLRSLGDSSKVGLLERLDPTGTRLKLFQADIYKPDEFAAAIQGCQIVVHMATPLQHYAHSTQYKNTSEAAVDGVRIIMESCLKSNTVTKVIYAGTVLSAAPLEEVDGAHGDGGYKDSMDETCWTPLNRTYDVATDYVHSKSLTEKHALSYNGKGIAVVSLALGLVGGDTIQSTAAESMLTLISQATQDELFYNFLRVLEETMGKVPILHIQDVAEAMIFAIENPQVNGRYLCANGYLKSSEIASIIQESGQGISIPQGFIEDTKREIKWGSRMLEDLGFEYKCDGEKTVRDSLVCAKKLGTIS